jgi:ABC-2 type transport system permease protein
VAVYERAYRGYSGDTTPEWSRFLVLPRYTFRRVFSSRLFLSFYIGCFLLPASGMFVIYLMHNLSLLERLENFGIGLTGFWTIDASFFMFFLTLQSMLLGFVLVLIVGPPLISVDLAQNGLPLYLARPIRRREYVAGKLTVLVSLLSSVTWVPILLMFLLQAYMAGDGWWFENLRIAVAIFLGSWIWIAVLSLLALAVSASAKRKNTARVVLFGLIFILASFGTVVGAGLGMSWGYNLNLPRMMLVVWTALIGLPSETPEVSVVSAAATLAVVCGLSLWILRRKVRAYEVVR